MCDNAKRLGFIARMTTKQTTPHILDPETSNALRAASMRLGEVWSATQVWERHDDKVSLRASDHNDIHDCITAIRHALNDFVPLMDYQRENLDRVDARLAKGDR